MTAMPILNRLPDAHHAAGLLIVLALILLTAAARNVPFFLHTMGMR
jgi:hypothetical protein